MGSDAFEKLAPFNSGMRLAAMPADVVERAKACFSYASALGIAAAETNAVRVAACALELVEESAGVRYHPQPIAKEAR